jgi:two-component system, OmpR family, response regulator
MVTEQWNWTRRPLKHVTRVLIVDDYRGAAVATAEYLSLDGIQTRVAGGCAEALEILRHWVPDVVLLDLMMPQRDGFDTARGIRESATASGVFICAYTAKHDGFIARSPDRALFDGYFRKGSSPDRLVAYLRHLTLCETKTKGHTDVQTPFARTQVAPTAS